MAKKTADRITEILQTMDSDDFINALRILQEDVGDERLLEVLESATTMNIDFNPKYVSKCAAECTEINEHRWYSIACRDEYGRYIDSGEHAAEIILDNLSDEFEKNLKMMVITGNEEKASEYLIAIADGLEYSDGILTQECEDYVEELSGHIRECAEEHRFDEAFDY